MAIARACWARRDSLFKLSIVHLVKNLLEQRSRDQPGGEQILSRNQWHGSEISAKKFRELFV